MPLAMNAGNIILVGGALCLDFANIVGHRPTDHAIERLHSYANLVTWSHHAGILDDRGARGLLRAAARHPRAAQMVLNRALELREAIAWIFYATSRGRSPKPARLATLNIALKAALGQVRITRTGAQFQWDWMADRTDLDRMLWPIARSAAELLTSHDLAHVRQCAQEGCGWLFLDVSRNRRRRWCTMNICGNRAKVRRFYRRMKAGRGIGRHNVGRDP